MTSRSKRVRLGTVIASRTMRRGDSSNVIAYLGQPRRAGKDWMCPFQVVGAGDETVKQAFGVDSMQALQLAVEALRAAVLSVSDDLEWLELPDLGFSRAVPVFLGKQRVARLNQAIDRELMLWSRAARRSR